MTPFEAEKAYLFLGLVMMVWGVWHIVTGKINFRGETKNRPDKYSYVLEGGLVVYLGWCKAIFGIFICVSGIQVVQKVHPNLIDAVQSIGKTLVNASERHIFAVFVIGYLLMVMSSSLLAQFFGERVEFD
jgi:hypothetical protein